MSYLFFGTPVFAADVLRDLLDAGVPIAAVVTQPDKPAGRRRALTPPPVKELALARNLPVYQMPTLRGEVPLSLLRSLSPRALLVVAYGKILPPELLRLPPLGCVNLHASLLPAYRGAAPIERAILAGESETGVTTMRMDEGLDTGDILLQERVPISPRDTGGSLRDKLALVGAPLLRRTIAGLEAGTLTPVPQESALASYAAKITSSDCPLDFTRRARDLCNAVRALSPAPLAETTSRARKLKVLEATVLPGEPPEGTAPGTILSASREAIAVACARSILGITAVKPAGGRAMSCGDFVNGRGVAVGDIWGA